MNEKVVKVYSQALFQLGQEKNKLDEYRNDLGEVGKVLKDHDELDKIINNPLVSSTDKKSLLKDLFQGLNEDVVNLLYVLIDKSRFGIVEDLVRDFNKKYNEANNLALGTVYSSKKLSASDLEDLVKALEKKYDKKVELKNEVDESLIGGISVKLGGIRLDNSIKSRLTDLKRRLTKKGE